MAINKTWIISASGKATHAGAGATLLAWATSQEALGIAGFVVAILGLAINWYYKSKDDKRAQAEHDKRMEELK